MRVAHTGETFAYHGTKHLRNARKLLVALEQLSREQPGHRPDIRELMRLTGMSSGGVQAALKTLCDDYGYAAQGETDTCAACRTIRLVQTTY